MPPDSQTIVGASALFFMGIFFMFLNEAPVGDIREEVHWLREKATKWVVVWAIVLWTWTFAGLAIGHHEYPDAGILFGIGDCLLSTKFYFWVRNERRAGARSAIWFSGILFLIVVVAMQTGWTRTFARSWRDSKQSPEDKGARQAVAQQRTEENRATIEVNRRRELLESLRNDFILRGKDVTPPILAHTAYPPADWMNRKLRAMGETWIFAPDPQPTSGPTEDKFANISDTRLEEMGHDMAKQLRDFFTDVVRRSPERLDGDR